MPELLLTHGYFLYEDPKEMQIMKPYAPLGILYLCSHLREKGFEVDVFDTTFSSRDSLFHHLRTETPSVLGIYANLMTRSNAVEIMGVAREAGWRVIVGGPEPGAYAQEYLESGAEFVVFGEGEGTMEELLTASLRCITHRHEPLELEDRRHRLPRRPGQFPAKSTTRADRRPGCAAVARPASN